MASLSQRYRPGLFTDMTGQSSITETLRKEVATGMLGHAYLFCGPRGVGKTTAARVFAKALNCEVPKDGEPCGVCRACLAIQSGTFLDMIELDAATHTGIDTVREAIIEHVRFAPAMGKRKVYILDEAHMLSTASWNALLKTLEEPPAYAVFILATTEWHKVPATIVSRCQRFEFRRISDQDLLTRVQALAKSEGWILDAEVARLIVSRADGCVRDAETLLGQLGSLGETQITSDVAELVIPRSRLPLAAGLMGFWADANHVVALKEIERLIEDGVPVLPLFDDLLLIVRRLLAASADASMRARFEQGVEDERALAPLIGRFAPHELSTIALILMERRRDGKQGMDPAFMLELASTMIVGQKTPSVCHPQPSSSPENLSSSAGPSSPDLIGGSMDSSVKPGNDKENTVVAALSDDLNIGTVRRHWLSIIRAVDEQNHSLPFILKISQPEEVRGNVVLIRFQYSFHCDKIVHDVKHRQLVEACASKVLGSTVKIDGTVGEDPSHAEARQGDMVSNILKAFGGQVVE